GLGKMWDYRRQQHNPADPGGVSVGATLGIIAFAVVLIVLFWHSHAFSRNRPFAGSLHHDTRTVELQGAKSVNAELNISAGRLEVRGGSSHLLDANFEYLAREGTPEVEYNVSGSDGQLSISQSHDGPN